MKIPNISLAILGFVHLGKGVSGHVLPQTHDLLKRDNRYLDNATDIQVIIDLSDSGWCMKYSDGLSGQQSLASCEIYCSNTHGDNAVDWEVSRGPLKHHTPLPLGNRIPHQDIVYKKYEEIKKH